MSTSGQGRLSQHPDGAEATLRVIANLPVPEGLADRVNARLRTAPRTGRVLNWPSALGPVGWGYTSAMRGAAAAAIVCVVAGGGWRIYSRVQPGSDAKMVARPALVGPARSFSIGGSVYTPDPVRAPILTHAVVPDSAAPESSRPARDMENGANRTRKRLKGRKCPQ